MSPLKPKWSTADAAETIIEHHEQFYQSLYSAVQDEAKTNTLFNVSGEAFCNLALELYCAHLATWLYFLEDQFSDQTQCMDTIRRIIDIHKKKSLKLDPSVDRALILARGVAHLEFVQYHARLTLYMNVCENGCGALVNLGLPVPSYVDAKLRPGGNPAFQQESPFYPISHVVLVAFHRAFQQLLARDDDGHWQAVDPLFTHWFDWWIDLARVYQKAREEFAFQP